MTFTYTCPNSRCSERIPAHQMRDQWCPACGTDLFPLQRDLNDAKSGSEQLRETVDGIARMQGVRMVDGEPMYSAAWLDPPATLTELERRRAR